MQSCLRWTVDKKKGLQYYIFHTKTYIDRHKHYFQICDLSRLRLLSLRVATGGIQEGNVQQNRKHLHFSLTMFLRSILFSLSPYQSDME